MHWLLCRKSEDGVISQGGAVGAVAPGPAAGTIAAGHETILLVEDDELVRNMTKCALEEIGYKPLVAASPQEAIELCSQKGSEIRLMLTDVVMKGMNGMELRDRISALNPSIKVLFMSGYASCGASAAKREPRRKKSLRPFAKSAEGL